LRSLRSIIFRRIVIVAIASFTLSAGFTYYYYQTILLKQMLHDDETKLKQTVRQLEYMTDDIGKFASSLIISEQVQSVFKEYGGSNTFNRFRLLQDTFNYLNDNKGLRKEVTSFALVLPDGEAFWSDARYDNYFQDRMKEEWYQNFLRSGKKHAFTKPHPMFFNATIESNTISYIVKVKDLDETSREIGELILNLDYNSFESLMTFGSADFDDLIWSDESHNVLYEKNQRKPDNVGIASLRESVVAQAKPGIHQIRGGYVVTDRFAESNWQLTSFTSQHSLIERSKFVIYLLAVFSLTSTVLILALMMPAIFRITRPIMRLYNAMNAVSSGNLQTSITIQTGDELEKLGQGFNRMTEQLRIHLNESIRHEQEKREMELELLLSQLNPHFVYNTLNAVIYMAQKHNNEDITKMVGAFIRILQDAAKIGEGQSLISLSDEIGILRDYVSIQSYRYADMFEVLWDLDEQAVKCPVPRNLIQPFVENAIFHGICPKDMKGVIRISAKVDKGRLVIVVEDDGVGIEQDRLETIGETKEERRSPGLRHIGLANTRKRLEHLYGGQAELRFDSELGKGTKVTISLPGIVRTNHIGTQMD
jgi:two-component system sensor histidine kinase YesM